MFRFELSEQMTAAIFKCLGDHPFRDVAHVIGELQRQIDQQQRMQMPQQSAGNGADRQANVE